MQTARTIDRTLRQQLTVGLAQLNPTVNAPSHNLQKGIAGVQRARSAGCDVVLLPECFMMGYPPKDLTRRVGPNGPVDRQRNALDALAEHCHGITAIVGFIDKNTTGRGKPVFNAAAVLADGRVKDVYHKILLPTYGPYDEARNMEPGSKVLIVEIKGVKCAVIICEDGWKLKGFPEDRLYRRNPLKEAVAAGAEMIFEISASPYHLGKEELHEDLLISTAKEFQRPVFYCNQVGGNDGLIFYGSSLAVDASGTIRGRAKTFEEDLLVVKAHPDAGSGWNLQSQITPWTGDFAMRARRALVLGTRDYHDKTGIFNGTVFGLSGGIDSAVTACLSAEAVGAQRTVCLSLPTEISEPDSWEDAEELVANVGLRYDKISMADVHEWTRRTLLPFFPQGFQVNTAENFQPRLRMIPVMAYSGQYGLLAIGTGNKSELSVGFCTLFGDMGAVLGMIADCFKGLVYAIADTYPEIPHRIKTKPPSAGLRKGQLDTDSLPPYPILDAILQRYIEREMEPGEIVDDTKFDPALVRDVVGRVDRSTVKHFLAPLTLRLTPLCFGDDRQIPIAQGYGA